MKDARQLPAEVDMTALAGRMMPVGHFGPEAIA